MSQSQLLIEAIEDLLETDLFKQHGFSIDKHIYLSPKDKDVILKKRKRVIEPHLSTAPRDRRRIINIYKHEDQIIGSIEHQSISKHPMEIHYYSLKKTL